MTPGDMTLGDTTAVALGGRHLLLANLAGRTSLGTTRLNCSAGRLRPVELRPIELRPR